MPRFRFQVAYFLSWVVFFCLCRLVFLLYFLSQAKPLGLKTTLATFLYGARLDASFAAYFSAIPFLLCVGAWLLKSDVWKKAVKGYTYLFLVLVSLLQATDLGLYGAWGFRLDATPLQYIQSPAEMAASAASAPLFLLAVIWLFLSAAGIFLFSNALKTFPEKANRSLAGALASLALLALLVLPMRGGLQQIPINQSAVYFSEVQFANHAALNVPWNVMHALIRNDYSQENPYAFFSDVEAETKVRALYPPFQITPPYLLKSGVSRPNVLLVILESFTANHVGILGAEKPATPNLDSLAAEGLLFTHIFASADRSEKGLAAILSGYPAQPTTSVMKSPRKSEHLPYLSQEFRKAGYTTSYYYGGELGFANLKSYLLNGGFHTITEKADFDKKHYNSKWGVHDHVLFERVLSELSHQKAPFFSAVFTLSSHEPYEIPVKAFFDGKDEPAQFRNSMRYTDQALGDFIRKAKKQPWWNNTLVIFIADHGHRFPEDVPNHSTEKFRIPLVFSGGALAQTGRNQMLGSQTDLATTLLRQLQLPDSAFVWGKDLLNPQSKPHAFYVFNNGFGFVTDSGSFAFDNISKTVMEQQGKIAEKDLAAGKAYMQASYHDFIRR